MAKRVMPSPVEAARSDAIVNLPALRERIRDARGMTFVDLRKVVNRTEVNVDDMATYHAAREYIRHCETLDQIDTMVKKINAIGQWYGMGGF